MTQFDDGLIQGYTELTGDKLHIHFYGSNQAEDWALDFMALRWREKHAGFQIAAKQATVLVRQMPIDDVVLIRITGHSFGGAVAVLVGAALQHDGKLVMIETAGAPAVGSWLWWLTTGRNLPHDRYEVVGDPVPSLLPWWLGWKKSGRLIKLYTNIQTTFAQPFARHQPPAYQPHVDFTL